MGHKCHCPVPSEKPQLSNNELASLPIDSSSLTTGPTVEISTRVSFISGCRNFDERGRGVTISTRGQYSAPNQIVYRPFTPPVFFKSHRIVGFMLGSTTLIGNPRFIFVASIHKSHGFVVRRGYESFGRVSLDVFLHQSAAIEL